jgi:hypothetical protein
MRLQASLLRIPLLAMSLPPLSRLPMPRSVIVLSACLSVASTAFAQFGGRNFGGGGRIWVSETTETAREVGTRNYGTPIWENPMEFQHDVFTFARLRWDRGFSRSGSGSWTTDLPDADLNLSYRLQQMTSMAVDPNGRIIRATDPQLARFPFLFVSAPGSMELRENEVLALRRYLNSGGFMLFDDFWANQEWNNLESVMSEILPGRSFQELSLEHPLYRAVFRITEKAQVPRIGIGVQALLYGTGTWEQGDQGREVHHRAILDDKGRIMVLALHNTDTGDGWEREGENYDYFREFAEKFAYPLGINIMFYMMTH